jgi:hypothetical protein
MAHALPRPPNRHPTSPYSLIASHAPLGPHVINLGGPAFHPAGVSQVCKQASSPKGRPTHRIKDGSHAMKESFGPRKMRRCDEGARSFSIQCRSYGISGPQSAFVNTCHAAVGERVMLPSLLFPRASLKERTHDSFRGPRAAQCA